MELSKQEMELFLLFPDHWSNNFFNFSKQIQNWFWKQEIELSKQKMELFLFLPELQ